MELAEPEAVGIFDEDEVRVRHVHADQMCIRDSGSTVEGIGFAIPINDVLGMIYDIQENGRVTDKAYLGVTVRDLDTETAQSYGLPTGVYILSLIHIWTRHRCLSRPEAAAGSRPRCPQSRSSHCLEDASQGRRSERCAGS